MARKITPSSDPAHKETDRLIAGLEKKIRHIYSEAYGNAAEKFTSYMAAFDVKDRAHRADVSAGRWSEQEYKDWKRNQLLYGDTLAQIRDTLAADLHKADKIAIQMARDQQVDVYVLNHNYGTYEVEHGLGIDTSYTLYDHDTVERLMEEDPDLLPKPSAKRQREIDAKDIQWNKQHLTSTFTASILSGDDIPTMAKRIASVAEMDQRAAIRNARTMCTGAENGGRLRAYTRAQGMGIDLKQQWVATLDNRTRDSHRIVDGEIIKVGEKFSNGLRFPGDPNGPAAEVYNCRCCTVSVVNGIDPMVFDKSDVLQRKLENSEITYEEWKTQHQRQTPDFLMKKMNEKVSDEDEKKAFHVAMDAELELPATAILKAGSFTVEAGYPNSSCDWQHKTIRMGINPKKSEFKHELGHILEHYALDADKVDEYKRWLVEGKTRNDIYSEIRYKDTGVAVPVFFIRGSRFETPYQSRLYVHDINKAINPDGSINIDYMWECVSEPFQIAADGGKISRKAYELLKEVLE